MHRPLSHRVGPTLHWAHQHAAQLRFHDGHQSVVPIRCLLPPSHKESGILEMLISVHSCTTPSPWGIFMWHPTPEDPKGPGIMVTANPRPYGVRPVECDMHIWLHSDFGARVQKCNISAPRVLSKLWFGLILTTPQVRMCNI